MKKFDKTSMTEAEKQRIRDAVNGGLPMDMLKALFEMQKELDSVIFEKHKDKLPESLSEWVQKYILAMLSELDEILREINWKWWKGEKQIDMEKLHEEVSDLWFFLIALTQRVGMSADDIFKVYETKREENFARQEGRSKDGSAYDYRDGGVA
jgi:dimeric dUTPase (all-alpha-NTP-PPase superfamily)